MHTTQRSICASALQAIGNTPLVQLNKVVPADSADMLVKLETIEQWMHTSFCKIASAIFL